MPLSISRAVKMLNRVGLEFSIEELATKLGISLKTVKRYILVKNGACG
jgi:DNA-directed RNA polymerase specialized sigma24 family protein